MVGTGFEAKGTAGAVADLPHRIVAEGLAFPEGPVALADGSVLVVEVRAHDEDRMGVFYATVDGSFARRAIFPLIGPNGIGLSPAGTELYVAETPTGRLWAWDIVGPGRVDHRSKHCLANTLGHFDSLAVEADGTVVVAALGEGLCVVRPDGEISYVRAPGPLVTNVCWGGEDLRTAYVTEAAEGLLLAYEWPRAGLRLTYNR